MIRQGVLPFVVAVSIFIAGCALGPTKFTDKTGSEDLSDSGVIVGRIQNPGLLGTGIQFKDAATGKSYNYFGATSYSPRLPEGDYDLVVVGDRAGVLAPYKMPFSFHVSKDRIAYIGSLSI